MSARKSCLGLKEYTVQHKDLLPSQQPKTERQIPATRSKKTCCGRQRAYDGVLLSRGQGRKGWDFPHLISRSPSVPLKYHKAWLALVIHTHFSTPRGTEVQDFQVEKGRRMLLDTPDIMKHKTPHRGFHRAGEEKEWGKLIPKKPQHYFKLCKAAGWSISGWTGLSADIIVIIYYITSHIAAFSIHPQPPPGALTLSLCSYVALVFQLSSI